MNDKTKKHTEREQRRGDLHNTIRTTQLYFTHNTNTANIKKQLLFRIFKNRVLQHMKPSLEALMRLLSMWFHIELWQFYF